MEAQREREQAFLARLWATATSAGLNDTQLAARLGVSSPTISRLKSGHIARRQRGGLSLRVVSAAVKHFPDLGFYLPIDLPECLAVVNIRPRTGAA